MLFRLSVFNKALVTPWSVIEGKTVLKNEAVKAGALRGHASVSL